MRRLADMFIGLISGALLTAGFTYIRQGDLSALLPDPCKKYTWLDGDYSGNSYDSVAKVSGPTKATLVTSADHGKCQVTLTLNWSQAEGNSSSLLGVAYASGHVGGDGSALEGFYSTSWPRDTGLSTDGARHVTIDLNYGSPAEIQGAYSGQDLAGTFNVKKTHSERPA